MESRWYLAPGQTLENTTLADRKIALHASASAWKKITAHLDRNRLQVEALEKERAHKKALKEGSAAMTKTWTNSVEYVRNKKEEERKKRANELEEEKMKKFLEVRSEQEEIRQAYIEKVKKTMYYDKAFPRYLNGALLESEAIYERQKQLEFKEFLRKHEEEEEAKYAQRVKQAAEDEIQEKLDKQSAQNIKKREWKEMYLKEIHDKKTFIKSQRDKRIERQRIDNEHATEEFEKQQKIKREDILKARQDRKDELMDYIAKDQEIKRQLKKEDDDKDEVIAILDAFTHNIACLRKDKDEEIKEQLNAKRVAASKQAIAASQASTDLEQRILKKAQDEEEAREEQKRLDRIEKARQLRQDRDDDRKAFLQKHEKQLIADKEMKKWELLNRQKNDDITKEHMAEKKRQQWENVLQYRKDLFDLMEINKTKKNEDVDATAKLNAYLAAKWEAEDKKFFDYANELVEHCRSTGRSTHPIGKVIDDYKKQTNMDPPPKKNCLPMEEYFAKHGNMLNTTPGKMSHDPRSDPNYRRCKCCKERIYH